MKKIILLTCAAILSLICIDGVFAANIAVFGTNGDLPVAGDWNGDGKAKIGVFRPSEGKFYIDLNGDGLHNGSDAVYELGTNGDKPVSGDWNNNNKSDIGVYRQSQGAFYLDIDGDFVWESSDKTFIFGTNGDWPVAGDWNNDGNIGVGVFRPTEGIFYFSENLVCTPGLEDGCRICNSEGSGWNDFDTKCASGQKCQNGKCSACIAKTCADLGYKCGFAFDGCGGTLNCGNCTSGKVCSSYQCGSLPTIQTYVVPAISDAKILSDSLVSDKYKSTSISISAAKGEYEPASFVLRSDRELSSLSIEAANLTGTAGSIPAANIDIRSVKVWWQAGIGITVPDLYGKQLTPELLLKNDSIVNISGTENYLTLSDGRRAMVSDPAGIPGISNDPTIAQFPVKDSASLLPVQIQKNSNKQFWVTVKIPETAAAGKYTGKINLKSDNRTLKQMTLTVTVLPFKLSESKINYSMYYVGWPDNTTATVHSDKKSPAQYSAEMKDMVAHGVLSPTTWFLNPQILDLRKTAGISNKNIYHSGYWIVHDSSLLSGYRQMALDAGAQNYYMYGYDEQDLSQYRPQIQAAHNAGAKLFCAEYLADAKTSTADILDILVASGAPDQSLAKIYHDNGNKIYSYSNPQSGQETPETYRRNYGLLLWQKDYDGAMNFAYQSAFNNTWNDFDYYAQGQYYREHNFTYPTVDGVIGTVQWEGFREGTDDVKYLSTLLNRIAYAKSKGINVSTIESWVNNLKSSDLATKNLDDVRKQMATYISSLPDPGI